MWNYLIDIRLKKHKEKKLVTVEMWFMRGMYRIPWTARMANKEVLRCIRQTRSLIKCIRIR